MLSYRHAFHAGSHADVLKHAVLVHLLRHLAEKEKPYWFIDTHAGAGAYALDMGPAAKRKEHAGGIARLWQQTDTPTELAEYLSLVRELNSDGSLRRYPGSPELAARLARREDRLRLFELHTTESRLLARHFAAAGPRVLVKAEDGFVGLKTFLPPPPRRGLILIDPSYEDKRDYQRVKQTLRDALTRFATGVYLVWYPQVKRIEAREFADKLKRLPIRGWLNVTLTVSAPPANGYGLYGSGLFVINPLWTLAPMLEKVMPYLVKRLGQDGEARFSMDFAER
jgi:23S rRNA (adenine2030-N6)-methyltransferase